MLNKYISLALIIYIKCLCISPCYSMFDGLYENLVNAQDTLKDLASSVNIGLQTLGKTVKFVEKFVDSTIEEDCIYTCPQKAYTPVPNPSHEPRENGCGSFGLYLEEKDLPRPEMVECCNKHDVCYDSCGLDKEDCDKEFKRCLYKTCDVLKDNKNIVRHKICQGGAKLLFTATITVGCTAYKDAQSKACLCEPIRNKENKKFKKSNEL